MQLKSIISQLQSKWLIIILILGLIFRCVNLDQKVYWVDEVATRLRIYGYTQTEFVQEISKKPVITITDLQQYQKPGKRTFQDTIYALTQSPEHAPLYFILVKFWVQIFGSSMMAIRSLSIVLSLLAFPCLYWLCLALFHLPIVGKIAVALWSVSPFYVAYAQEARPYSLWVVTILLSSLTLLKAIRFNTLQTWGLYALTLTLGLYTSLLSIFLWVAQTVYLLALEKFKINQKFRSYVIASTLSFLSFTPWLWVMLKNWDNLQDNTIWMRVHLDFLFMIPLWIYNTFILFIESPVSLDASVIPRIILDFNLLILVLTSLVCLYRQTPQKTWLYVLSLMIIPYIILILSDLILGGQLSTAARYIIPYHLGINLAVAYGFSYQLNFNKLANPTYRKIWKIILIGVLFIGIFSCIYLVNTSPKYQKTRNLSNIPIAQIINQIESPIIIAEKSQMIDILSLSYLLKPNTKIYNAKTFNFSNTCQSLFLFNPSQQLQTELLKQNTLKLDQVYKPKLLIPSEIYLSLWTVKNSCS